MEHIATKLNEYFGLPFERVCIEYLYRRHEILTELVSNYSSWWGTDPIEKMSAEIDIVGTSQNYVVFGECKWRNAEINDRVLKRLQYHARLVHVDKEAIYILFSKFGYSDDLKRQSDGRHMILIDKDDLLWD